MFSGFNLLMWLVAGVVSVIGYLAFQSLPALWPRGHDGEMFDSRPQYLQFAMVIGITLLGPILLVYVLALTSIGYLQRMRNRPKKGEPKKA